MKPTRQSKVRMLLAVCMLVALSVVRPVVAMAQDSVVNIVLAGGIELDMVWVQGGTFVMGSNTGASRAHSYEVNRPEHEVSVGSFYIGRTEVTQAVWQAVMGGNPSWFGGGDSLPVENVSWNDAQQFVTLLSQMTGRRFRLPTEAEWEYAARGGKYAKRTSFAGCQREKLSDYGWFCVNSDRTTHRVALLQPNELGLYDMSGNVAEWCYDWLAPYNANPQVEPRGPATGDSRVLRGGHYNSTSSACTVYDRSWYEPAAASEYFGLRVVLEADRVEDYD